MGNSNAVLPEGATPTSPTKSKASRNSADVVKLMFPVYYVDEPVSADGDIISNELPFPPVISYQFIRVRSGRR